jgi:hypothetical protein
MWSKLYIGIIVLVLLIFLYTLNTIVQKLNNKYNLQENYGLPINCFSNTVCGMNGNILLIFFIYLIIPQKYFDSFLEAIKPQNFNKLNDENALNKLGETTINEIEEIAITAKNKFTNVLNL